MSVQSLKYPPLRQLSCMHCVFCVGKQKIFVWERRKLLRQEIIFTLLFWYSLSCTHSPCLSGGEVERWSRGTKNPSHGDVCILEKHVSGQILKLDSKHSSGSLALQQISSPGTCQLPNLVIHIYPHSFPATMNAGFNTILQQATYSETLKMAVESRVC